MNRLVLAFRWATLLTAALLAVMVAVSPWIASPEPEGWGERVVALFASDPITRRGAIFAGLGLLATALIFFRPRPAEDIPPPTPPLSDSET